MNTAKKLSLFDQFSIALGWNTIGYATNRLATLIRTLFLYHILSLAHFTYWATTMSTIFLLLLWLDPGFRKSIPRYIASLQATRNGTAILFITQVLLLILGLPFLIMMLSGSHGIHIILAIMIYGTQGMLSLIRTTNHAAFNNKQFNLLEATMDAIELLLLISIAHMLAPPLFITSLFILKATSSLILCVIGYRLYTKKSCNYQIEKPISYKAFIVHSLSMWCSTIIKSLSERNMLYLFIVGTTGIEAASIFKIAQDAALFFYRTTLKAIGVADTALLAQIQLQQKDHLHKNRIMISAINIVMAKTARLVLPLLGVIGIFCYIQGIFKNHIVFSLFLIMIGGYIGEVLLLPYERMLEVRQNYRYLFLSYLPYIITIGIIISTIRISCIGLVPLLLLIQSVRLVSYFLIRLFSYTQYGI